jgi:outer membrane protein
LEETLTKQESVLSPEAKKAKQEDLQKKFLAYQKRATDLNREIQDKKTEVLNDFHQQLQAVVKRVAEREGYSLVFDKGSGTPAEMGSLLYAKDSLAITEKVLAELDKGTK